MTSPGPGRNNFEPSASVAPAHACACRGPCCQDASCNLPRQPRCCTEGGKGANFKQVQIIANRDSGQERKSSLQSRMNERASSDRFACCCCIHPMLKGASLDDSSLCRLGFAGKDTQHERRTPKIKLGPPKVQGSETLTADSQGH